MKQEYRHVKCIFEFPGGVMKSRRLELHDHMGDEHFNIYAPPNHSNAHFTIGTRFHR